MSEPLIQREKIIAVIEAEQRLIDAELVSACDRPGHCAVGALLHAAGMTDRSLERVQYWHARSKAGRLLKREYGLIELAVHEIVATNDRAYDDNRKSRVIKCVNRLADEQASRLTVTL